MYIYTLTLSQFPDILSLWIYLFGKYIAHILPLSILILLADVAKWQHNVFLVGPQNPSQHNVSDINYQVAPKETLFSKMTFIKMQKP